MNGGGSGASGASGTPDKPATDDEDSAQVFERAAALFGLLAAPQRLRILSLVCCRPMTAPELRAALGGRQPGMAQSLAMLRRFGVLTRRREGADVVYGLHPGQGGLLCEAVRRMVAQGGTA